MKYLILVLFSLNCYADPACDKAIGACQDLVQAQDKEITDLKDSVVKLEDRINIEEKASYSPWYVYILGGALVGATGGLGGPLVGIITGIGVGTIFGLENSR